MARLRPIVPLLLLLLVWAAPLRAGPKAFDIAEDQFFARVHRVALGPCKFPGYFRSSDTLAALQEPVRRQVDSLLVAALRGAGFEVVPGSETGAVFDRIADSLGGIFDATTGQFDSVRAATAEKLAHDEIRARYQVDTWAYPAVYGHLAAFDQGVARWNGVTEKITGESFGKGLLKSLTLRTADTDFEGRVAALSLFVPLVATDDTKLYSWSGGLHLTSLLHNGKFVDIPHSRYFTDRGRIDRAVAEALEALSKAVRKRANKK